MRSSPASAAYSSNPTYIDFCRNPNQSLLHQRSSSFIDFRRNPNQRPESDLPLVSHLEAQVQENQSLSAKIFVTREACSITFVSMVVPRFLAERGALILLDANDAALSQTDIYEKVAKDKNGWSWESFEVYRHLKSLGYIINRYGLPWTLKINKSCCNSKCLEGTLDSADTSKPNREDETSSIICQLKEMRINEMMPNFDVYLPNSKFRKSAPGNPSFFLYLVSDDPPSKAEIQVLEECKGIPLKFCHLEHGRVSFFSFDKVELPFLP